MLKRQINYSVFLILVTACGGESDVLGAPVVTIMNPIIPPVENALTFRDVTNQKGVDHASEFSEAYIEMPRYFAGGAASGDVDNDGDIDVFITRGDTQPNLLYINEGNVFTDRAEFAGLALPNTGVSNYKLSGPVFADMDGDRDLDLFVGGINNDPSLLFQNNGDGTFSDITVGSGIDLMTSKNTISAAFGDYDLDGDLDIAMAHWGSPRDRLNPSETETLWRNDSDSSGIKFTAVSASSGISGEIALDLTDGVLGVDHDYTFAPNFSDINNDGYPDLLSVSDFRGSRVFLNNQDSTFTNITDPTQITDSNGMGAAAGDYDNDGDIDWFVSSIDGNRLYQNDGGTMINITSSVNIEAGSWGWGSCFADFDLDGYLDIYQTNGWISDSGGNPNAPYTIDKSRLWISDGRGAFSDKSEEANMVDETQGRGVICADFDDDRDIDVLLLSNNSSRAAILWDNKLVGKNAIQVELNGLPPNTHGIGARISVKTASMIQMREVSIGNNFTSHNPTRQLFGLGDQTVIDELKVVWPDGVESFQTDVSVNQSIEITHPDN